MKKTLFQLGLMFTIFSSQAQTQQLTKIWESNEGLPVPESVLYDGVKSLLYVSLIDGSGTEKDGKGGIALLNLDGTMRNAKWATGLNAPKGLSLYKGLLYVADINSVVVIDVITGNTVDEIDIAGSRFLNDVTVDNNGIVYVSDTRDNKIYQIRNGNYSIYRQCK